MTKQIGNMGQQSWPPIPMDDSPTLFPMNQVEFLRQANVPIQRLRDWAIAGWLSFDPDKTTLFEETHLAEVRVVTSLVECILDVAQVQSLLEKLTKPYYYPPERLVYNFWLGRWQMVPNRTEEEIEKQARAEVLESFDELLEAYLEDMVEARDVARIERVIRKGKRAMRRAVSPE